MNTYIIPNSTASAFINVNKKAVIAAFEHKTGHKVLFAGYGQCKDGYRCVVVLDGVYTNEKVLQEISNYPFANIAWWVEEGLPVVDDDHDELELHPCGRCGKRTNLSENDHCGNCEREYQAEV